MVSNFQIRGVGQWCLIAAALLSSLCGCRREDSPPSPPAKTTISPAGKISLNVLYVGLPDTDRQQDFVSLLREHFEQVGTADYFAFQEDQTRGYDVVILDKDGLEWKAFDIRVSPTYSRSTLTVGVPGAFWVRSVSSRMGYM